MPGTTGIEDLQEPGAVELLHSPDPARLAYTGPDGYPRVIPVGFLWNGTAIVVCTRQEGRRAGETLTRCADDRQNRPAGISLRSDGAIHPESELTRRASDCGPTTDTGFWHELETCPAGGTLGRDSRT